jgi:hypothetical protein
VSFKGRLFAAGGLDDPPRGPVPAIGALWTSTDGRRWQQVQPSPFGDAYGVRLTATGSAIYAIAAGGEGSSPELSRVWRSTDGSAWELVTAVAPAGIGPFVGAPTGLVAVGSELAPHCSSGLDCIRTAIWSSPDGAKWTQATGGPTTFPAGFMTGVVRTRSGLVAVGSQRLGPLDRATRVWTSRGGAQWDAAPSPALSKAKATSYALAADDRTALLAGVVPSRTKLPPTTTTTRAPATVQNADGSVSSTITLCGTINGTPAVWTRRGSTDWTRAKVSGMGPAVPLMMVAAGRHWVGVAVAGDCSSSRPVLLTSPDARVWNRQVAAAPPSAAPAAHRQPTALAPTSSGAIAFVSSFPDSASPEVWIWTPPTRS